MRLGLLLLAACAVSTAGTARAAGSPAECSNAALTGNIQACDEAIAAERDPVKKAGMLYDRAWAHNERRSFERALRDLDLSIELDPNWAAALHERGFTLVELGEFVAARRDLEKAVSLRPDFASHHSELGLILRGNGDFAGSYVEMERQLALKPGDGAALLDRAEAALWLGRFDDAKRDVEAAAAIARKGDDTLAERARDVGERVRLWSKRTSGGSPATLCETAGSAGNFRAANLIGDCSAAFLAGRTPSEKASALTYRALAWLVGRRDRSAAAADREVVVAIEPDNADWLFNLGYSYYELGRNEAAIRLFDRSFARERTAAALSGRASARYRIGDKEGALTDATEALAMKPYPLALLVLGELAFDSGNKESAKNYWLRAYQTGWRDDALTAHLKSVGVENPDQEPVSR